MIELQSIYRNSFNCIHPAAILDPDVAALEHWNNLPEDIKSANSIDDFKRKLKTFLFMRAYEL